MPEDGEYAAFRGGKFNSQATSLKKSFHSLSLSGLEILIVFSRSLTFSHILSQTLFIQTIYIVSMYIRNTPMTSLRNATRYAFSIYQTDKEAACESVFPQKTI